MGTAGPPDTQDYILNLSMLAETCRVIADQMHESNQYLHATSERGV